MEYFYYLFILLSMKDILVVGSATYDIFLSSPLFKATSDPHFKDNPAFPTGTAECFAFGGKISVDSLHAESGGGATNAAVTFARHGLTTSCLAPVGSDLFATLIETELKKEGITTIFDRQPKFPTGYSTILLSKDGERTILTYRGAGDSFSNSLLNNKNFSASWLYLVSGHLLLPTIKKIFSLAHTRKIKIAMNPSLHHLSLGPVSLAPFLKHLSVLVLNREEGSVLTGHPYADKERILSSLRSLTPALILLTDGPAGATVLSGQTSFSAKPFKEKELLDRTGAGDAFGSGFVASLITAEKKLKKKFSLFDEKIQREALRFALANSTSVVEHIGAKPGILTYAQFTRQKRFKKNII